MLMNYLMEKNEENRRAIEKSTGKGKVKRNSTGRRIFLRLKPYRNKPDTFYDASLRASSSLHSAPIRIIP